MKRFKKYMFILVVLSLLIFCGYSAEVITIKYAHWNALVEQYNYVKAFERKYPNIKVEFTLIPEAEYSQKLNTMAMSGTAPDVLCLWECDITKFAKAGLIDPLDDYVKNSKELSIDDFIPAVKNLIKLQGKLYGLPWCFATEIMYYNKTLFDKAKVPYPNEKWTWKEFENAAKKLTIVKDGKVEQWGCDAIGFQGLWYSIIGTFGDEVVNSKGQFAIGEGAREFLKWWYDLTNKYKVVAPPQVTTSGVITTDLFVARKAAMAFNGSWMTSVYKDIKNFKWDIAPIPKGKRQYSTLHTGFFAINSKSKVKDAAWKFIEFCMSEEGQRLITKDEIIMSARVSIMKKGYDQIRKGTYKAGGPNGPTRWDAIEKTVQFADWGYVLLPPGLTFDLVKDFNAAILGQVSIEDVIKRGIEKAKDVLGEEGVAQ